MEVRRTGSTVFVFNEVRYLGRIFQQKPHGNNPIIIVTLCLPSARKPHAFGEPQNSETLAAGTNMTNNDVMVEHYASTCPSEFTASLVAI